MNYVESERAKYTKIFQFPGYGGKGHGAPIAPHLVKRAAGRGVLADFGCGRGGSFQPYIDAGFVIQPVDHVDVLDKPWRKHPKVRPMVVANLWADTLPEVDYAICTDVMEHIPEPHVAATVANLALAVKHGCLWTVCHVADSWGKRIGEPLHMTVKPEPWWTAELGRHWRVVERIKTDPGHTIYWTAH